MDWKFKKDIKPVSSSEFWYDITDGGYIRPEEMLADSEQNKKLQEAIDLVISFHDALEENNLLEEM